MSDSEADAINKTVDNDTISDNVPETEADVWKAMAAVGAELGAAVSDQDLEDAAGSTDLDHLNDNLQDGFDDNLSLEVNFGDGSSCHASDDKPSDGHGSSPAPIQSESGAADGKDTSSRGSAETPSDAGDTTPTASETLHSNSSNGNQSDTSLEAVTISGTVQKRNSLEIRNNIPNVTEGKKYASDCCDDKIKLQSTGAMPKMRKKSPGLARRLADPAQIQSQDRDSSSSERESEPAQIDTTVRSAQKDYESKLCQLPNSSADQKKDTDTSEPENKITANGKSDSFEKLCDSLLGNDSQNYAPSSGECNTSPEDGDQYEGQTKGMEIENEYDYIKYARIQHGDSYVGMRLAFSSSSDSLNAKRNNWSGGMRASDDEYLGSSCDDSPEKILMRQPRITGQIHMSKVNEDTLTEIPLNGSDQLCADDKNFSLSPEATECDSAEVESVISEEGKSSTSGMPIVEDGLSSSQGSDVEDISVHDIQDQTPSEILKRRYKAEIDHELQVTDTVSQENMSCEPAGEKSASLRSTPSHASGTSGASTLDQDRNKEVDMAIKDIKSAIERSKQVAHQRAAQTNDEANNQEPIWVMRDSYVKKLGHHNDLQNVRDEYQRHQEEEFNKQKQQQDDQGGEDEDGMKYPYHNDTKTFPSNKDYDTDEETDELLDKQYTRSEKVDIPELSRPPVNRSAQVEKRRTRVREGEKESLTLRDPENETVLIEGVLFRARYLGSTQLLSDGHPSKSLRMMQAQEAVGRIKASAPEGESQPSTEVDLFVSIEKIMVLNTDLQEIMMDHALRTISYIADIGDILVIMARRGPVMSPGTDGEVAKRKNKICCHVFETEEAQLIAQSIGQAFQVAYMEFLKANGIEDPGMLKEIDYQDVLNQQEIFGEELFLFSNKEMQKEVIVPKLKNEPLGVVIVESGWGSMVPTVVLANMSPNGAAARCGQLNIGDQIMSINGVSLVGIPLSSCQTYIKACRNQTAVKLNVVSCAPVVEVCIKRPDVKYQLGFSVQNGVICSLLRGGIAERGGVRVGHRIIEINGESVVAVPHEKIVKMLATSVGEIHMKTMPTSIFRLLTGQDTPHYI